MHTITEKSARLGQRETASQSLSPQGSASVWVWCLWQSIILSRGHLDINLPQATRLVAALWAAFKFKQHKLSSLCCLLNYFTCFSLLALLTRNTDSPIFKIHSRGPGVIEFLWVAWFHVSFPPRCWHYPRLDQGLSTWGDSRVSNRVQEWKRGWGAEC